MGQKMKLSHKLIDLGFFSALGTSDRSGTRVKRGTPNSQDFNNGVMVVYDEEGRPWIIHASQVTDTVVDSFSGYGLSRGAYVPHSNDGGYFLHEVVMKI